MATVPTIEGTCDLRFHAVRDAFADNFTKFGETGAAVTVVIDNKPVVDLWAGHIDAQGQRPWQHDTLVNVYSTTKGMTAICAHRLADEGRLDLDAPVAKYWPEFAQGGKSALPVRYLLSHQAGLAAVRRPLAPGALYDWDAVTTALAEQEPWWEPGTQHGYHALTFGHLVGEVVRRITGKSLGTYFRDEVARPLGADFHIGLAANLDARTSDLLPPPLPEAGQVDLMAFIMQDPEALLAKAFTNPLIAPNDANSREWRAAEIPAANGHTSAHGLATIYGALGNGGTRGEYRVLSKASIERALTMQADGWDGLLPLYTRFGLGFMLSTPVEQIGPNPRAFGHGGMGGSLGFADPDAKLGFGYVMNEMHNGLWLFDPRALALAQATYACL